MSREEGPWRFPVRLQDVPEGGRHFALEADEPMRAAVARTTGLLGLERLGAAFDVARHGAGGLRVTGEVSATVRQTCVVTLEPISSEIAEPVDVAFTPGESAAPTVADDAATAAEPPEPLIGGTIDLGAIAVEFLMLGIDPYPRKPGAVLAAAPIDASRESPFAALAALKKGSES
jgi:uncharacterized metal-binding protein YceD (DUF177 family)